MTANESILRNADDFPSDSSNFSCTLIAQEGAAGELITDGDYYREYNALHQLTRVRKKISTGKIIEEYSYGPDGERIMTVNYLTNTTIYTPFREWMMIVNRTGSYNYTYIYDGNTLVAKINPDGTKWFYHDDHLGSTSLITDENGNIVEETFYNPFGQVTSGAVRAGLFSVLLGNDSNLNLTYNRDYYLCTYINGEVQRNLGGSNTTKFRGGQGIIGAGNLTNGTFATGNYTFADNLTLGGWLFVKNDEDILSRVLRAPIKYMDFVDRTADENITGNWSISSGSMIGGTQAGLIGAGEWELVSWTNFTTRIDGSMKVGNIPPANEYKLDYIIWSRPLRVDNNATEPGIREIGMRFNNISAVNYHNLLINGAGSFSGLKGASFNVSRTNDQQAEMNISGTLLIRQIGSGIIYVNQIGGSPAPFNLSIPTYLYSGYLDGAGKLSDIQFFARPTLSGSGGADTGEINGTILLYRHKFFKIY